MIYLQSIILRLWNFFSYFFENPFEDSYYIVYCWIEFIRIFGYLLSCQLTPLFLLSDFDQEE